MAKPTVSRRAVRRKRWDERSMYAFADFNPANLLFQLDLCSRIFELFLELGRLVLAHIGLALLGRTLDDLFGLLEAEAGDRTDFLDDVDLLVARLEENDRELGFLDGRSRGRSRRGNSRDGSASRYAPFVFQQFCKLRRLDDSEAGQVIHKFLNLRHDLVPYVPNGFECV